MNNRFSTSLVYAPFFLFLLAGCDMNDLQNKQASDMVTLIFAGDTMLGRMVDKVIQTNGHSYVWGDTLPILKDADLRIINLETTFTKSRQKIPKVFNYKSNPKNVTALKKAYIDVVSIANNHIKDFDNEGLLETIQTLDDAQIRHVGAGIDASDSQKPVIITKNNITIGILGATDNEPGWRATENNPGTYYFHINELDQLLNAIRALKKEVDVLVVSLHWGPNMRTQPTPAYIDAAHAMINAGADIIHGHSAHIFQGIEVYKNKLILYDTGDFVDDYRVDPLLRNDWSFLFLVTITKNNIVSVKLVPTVINTMQVTLAKQSEKDKIIARMQELSKQFGTTISHNGIVIL